MKELEFISTIEQILSKSTHIGDDCAYLKDLQIVVTQDNLVEDIHFSRKFSSASDLAHKAVMVNLSDIYASGAKPKYLTIALSLPKDIDNVFIKEFYEECEKLSKEFDFEIIGGDITGAEKIFVSICAIGSAKDRKISSRKNAKVGDLIITSGVHGSSAAGLWALQDSITPLPLPLSHKGRGKKQINTQFDKLIKKHIRPTAQKALSQEISSKITTDYAMMDSSDGLADALFKIGEASKVTMSVDFNKIPYDKEIETAAKQANSDFKDWILYGGEDFQLIACLNEEDLKNIETGYAVIGKVTEKQENCVIEVKFKNKTLNICDLEKSFNHFKEQK